jgi:predicted outer membrane repeat protein
MTLAKSTFAANSAKNGGAIKNDGLITITNSTIANNTASESAGGIYNPAGNAADPHTVSVKNTIIAKNSDGFGSPDFSGHLKSQGYNLIGNAAGAAIGGVTTGNQLNVDPKLGLLRDNGGPTSTKALLVNSPALDKGVSGAGATDQRGFSRPVDSPSIPNANGGNGADIGAFEAQPGEATAASPADAVDDVPAVLED